MFVFVVCFVLFFVCCVCVFCLFVCLGCFKCWMLKQPNAFYNDCSKLIQKRVRCSSMVRAFAHGAMGRRVDPSWGGPIELFLVPASAPRQA